MEEAENNQIERPIQKKVYQRRRKSISKKKKIDSFVCNDYDDSIDEVDPNIILKEVLRDVNISIDEKINDDDRDAEDNEHSENDEDNEDNDSAQEEQNSQSVKKHGRPKKNVRDNENNNVEVVKLSSSVKKRPGHPRKESYHGNVKDVNKSSVKDTERNANDEDNDEAKKKSVGANENKSSSVKRSGRSRKTNNEAKKQTIGSKRKATEYKVYDDDDDNDGNRRIKKKMDDSSSKIADVNQSSAEDTEDNANDEDNEDTGSAQEEQNNEDSESLETPPIKRHGHSKKSVRTNENKSSSVKKRGRPRKSNDEEKKQTIGPKGKKHKASSKSKKKKKYKTSDENNKNMKIRTRTTPTTLFNAMAILNVESQKCLHEMGFGSMIGMAIHELAGKLGFYVIDNLDTETYVLSLSESSIHVTSESVHDILGIPIGGCSIESLPPRSPNDPFIKEWFSQFGEKTEIRPNDITDIIVSTKDAGKLFKMNFLMLFANTMGMCEMSGACNMFILKHITDDVSKLNKFRKKFEEDTTGIDNDDTTAIDNDDTTGIDKDKNDLLHSDSQMETDSSATKHEDVDINENVGSQMEEKQKNGNEESSYQMDMEYVHHSLNEDTTGLDNDDTTGIDKDKNDLLHSDSQMESDSTGSDDDNQKNSTFVYTSLDNNDIVKESVTNFEVGDSYHATGLYSTTEGDATTEPEDIDINEKVENEKHEIGNEASSSQMDKESVHPILNEDDKVGDSSPATGVCSVIEGDEVKFTEVEDVDINEKVEKEKQQIGNEESSSQMDHVNVNSNEDGRVINDSDTTIPDSVTEGKGVKFIENDNILVDDVPRLMVKCSFEEQKMDSSNECDVVIPDENKAIVQDSVERNEHSLGKEKNKISNEELRPQHTLDDNFKEGEQIQSAEDFDDVKHDVYNGPDLRSPYEYLPVDVKKPLSDVEKIVADTDLIFESQSGLELNHLEMETLTPTLMASAYVIDAWAELLNILEVYKDESLPLRYFFKITVYIPAYYIGKDKDDEKLAVFFPVCHEDHIYLICVYFNKGSIHLIDNSANGTDHKNQRYKGIPQAIRKVFVQYLYHVKHPKAEAIQKAKITRMRMKWRTKHNYTDCGVFTMLHMESYLGDEGEWKFGLAKESKQQDEQLKSLRSKFAAKIILSEFNLLRKKFMKLVHEFEQKPGEERKKTIDHAIANRDHRENIEEANIPSRNS
ncbi:ulp1 protease family, C-terminal catalytic domain-containing protein [Tanacetum coccineum]